MADGVPDVCQPSPAQSSAGLLWCRLALSCLGTTHRLPGVLTHLPQARIAHRGTIFGTTLTGAGMAVTASEARKNLFPRIAQVNNDRTTIQVTSRRGDAVLMSRDEYDALEETAHLLRSPANVRRLLQSLDQAHRGERTEQALLR